MKLNLKIIQKNKFGFTIIELLAVIVILAIISLIAIPIVLDVVKDSKKSSLLSGANFYEDAVKYAIANSGGISAGSYPITAEGNLCKTALPCSEEDTIKVKTDGTKPTGGLLILEGGEIIALTVVLEGETIVRGLNGEYVYTPCVLISGDKYTMGSKYECEVKPGVKYNFFVLSQEEDGTTNLIMDRNINSDGTPVTKYIAAATPENGVYNIVQWVSPSDYYSAGGQGSQYNSKGPITAMNFLNKATKSWENIKNLNITYDDEFGPVDGVERVKNFKVTGKARLPYYRELEMYDTETGRNAFLYDYLTDGGMQTNVIPEVKGYWTMASSSNNANGKHAAALTSTNGKVANVSAHIGVRPVINVNI